MISEIAAFLESLSFSHFIIFRSSAPTTVSRCGFRDHIQVAVVHEEDECREEERRPYPRFEIPDEFFVMFADL